MITQPPTGPELFAFTLLVPTAIKLGAPAGTSEGRCCPWLPSSAVLTKVLLLLTSLLISVTGILRWVAELCLLRLSRMRPLLYSTSNESSSARWPFTSRTARQQPAMEEKTQPALHPCTNSRDFLFVSPVKQKWKWEALKLSGYSSMPWVTPIVLRLE